MLYAMELSRARDLIKWPDAPRWKWLPRTLKRAIATHVQQVGQAPGRLWRQAELAIHDVQLGVTEVGCKQAHLVVQEHAAPHL